MKRRDDPNQTLFDWTSPAAPAVAPAPSIPYPPRRADETPPRLVQRLPWDFKTTFPEPLDAAIEAGVLDESDREPENIRELHECHARQCIAALKSLDVVLNARRRGIDPGTGKPPRTHAATERLRKDLAEEPARLEHAFRVMIETYESAFGPEAADAFQKAVRAWHAGIEVIAESPRSASSRADAPNPAHARTTPRRPSSALPVPRPLRSSVAAGVFGEDNGKPVNPSPDEVRAIMQQRADKMMDMSEKEFAAAVAECTEDFGPKAAAQLERHVRQQRGRSR